MGDKSTSAALAQSTDTAAMYLHMMKLTLTDSVYLNDPLATYSSHLWPNGAPARWKVHGITILDRLLSLHNLRIVRRSVPSGIGGSNAESRGKLEQLRKNGRDWPARAHTMIGLKRLNNLQFCVESVINDEIDGDLIETGVWRGGACIFMRAILKAYGDTNRTVWVADSFAGLPPPDPANYSADDGDRHHTFVNVLGVPRHVVEDNFRSYGLLDEQVQFLEGWFKDTLPSAPIDRLAVLRLDGDMYESTIQALEALYHKVSSGGFVIVDDHHILGCKKAVADFRSRNSINDPLVDIDGNGVFWRKH